MTLCDAISRAALMMLSFRSEVFQIRRRDMKHATKARADEDKTGRRIEQLMEKLSCVEPLHKTVERTGMILGQVLIQQHLGRATVDDVEAARAAYLEALRRKEDAGLMLETARGWLAACNEHRVQHAQTQQDERRATRIAAYEAALKQFKELIAKLTLPREKPRLNQAALQLWQVAQQAGKVASLRKYFDTLESRRGLEHLSSW